MSTRQRLPRASALVRVLSCVLSLALVLPVFLPGSVQAQTVASCAPVRLMPLGDSITVGKGSGGTNLNHNDYMTGYRQPLALKLSSAGYAVDFVGGEQTGRLATPSFDIDHEGHSGYTPGQIAYGKNGGPGIDTWLRATPPDLVLLHIGTNGNGLTQNSIATQVTRTEDILKKIDQYSPQIPVVLARIINRRLADTSPEERQKTTDFNIALQQMADRRIAAGDKIVVVDMEAALNYVDDMYDRLHPNEPGYAKMVNVWFSALSSMLPKCTTSKTALLVSSSTTLNASDAAIKSRLENQGYDVTIKDQAAATSADATGKTLVLVSSTVSSKSINTKFRDVTVPVITWEASLYDDFGMTGTVSGTDFGVASSKSKVNIVNAAHPLAAGLSGTVQTSTSTTLMPWGVPNANAAWVASLTGNANKAVVFGYDKGAAMPGLVAPARRVGLFLENDTAAIMTASGWKLFDAAINWAAGSGG